jgi:hypothetical protein
MKHYIRFERMDGKVYSFPRPHLRWLTLVDGGRIEAGFSSKLVTVVGVALEGLFEKMAANPSYVVREEPKRHSGVDTWVDKIVAKPHIKKTSTKKT